ncbi:MAG TPA: DUF4340 domain-containing protein [Candidatus Aminicenantes bacterium]|nr:DUF4340 domain-containing protein [Candidatus Aminicenantes bacterium]
MKFKTTIILFAIFLVLLAFVLFFEYKGMGEKDEEEKLLALSSDDVQKITFKKEDETISFQKDEEGEWLITEPLDAKADKYEVDRLASDFSDLNIERVVDEEPEELEKYGIPQKEISLWFKDKDEPVKILIGMENPLGNTFFAKRDDETKVVLIPSHLKSLMEKSLFDFREKNIFKFEAEDVKTVKLRAKQTRWQASKKGEEWFFKNPVNALAQSSEIDDILSSLSNLKAKEFMSEEKKKDDIKEYGLDRPEFEIIIGMPLANQEVTFSLHKEEDKLYATTSLSPKIVEAEDSLLSDLEKEAEELRENKVANFYSWEANRLHLKIGEIDWELVKDEEDNWHFESPLKEEADKSKIQTFIRKIESLEAEEFIDPPFSLNLKDYGLDNPQAEVKIWVNEDEENVKEITVLIGSEDKESKEVVVKNARFDYLFRVDSAFLEEFPKDIKDWKPEEEDKKEEK